MYKIIKYVIGFVILALMISPPIFAKSKIDTPKTEGLAKATTLVSEQFDGNTIACWMQNQGLIVSHKVTGSSGMEWPKGSDKTIDYASGLWLVGKTPGGEVRTASSEYSTEFKPGPILEDGTAGNPDDDAYIIYKINSDGTGDWEEWPFDQGAPALKAADGSDSLDADGKKIPMIIGDQTLFWVMNDLDPTAHADVFATNAMGIEEQVLVFGYNTADPLGNIMFIQWTLINKSTTDYDSCYVGVWDDPDMGNAADDLVGCDTTLSLGYCYNGGPVDATYGTTPPAIGFDFFQGPEAPKGSGNYLPMTSFVYYWNGAPDPYGDPEDATQMYNFMRGFANDGSSYLDPDGNPSKFVFNGDPVTQSGWLDSAPADRRFLMASGPFKLGAGETQVIVGAKIIAPGVDNLSAVSALRFFDSYAQTAFDNNFDMPVPPAPVVKVINLDQKVVLQWQDDEEKRYQRVESYDFKGYKFQGYNVYQGESSTGPWKLIKTFDIVDDYGILFDNTYDAATGMVLNKPVTFGSNAGITRNYTATADAISGYPLYNYKNYYFAVTAFAINPEISPLVVESGPIAITAVPTTQQLGVKINAEEGEAITTAHLSGKSDGSVTPIPVDPSLLTGNTYQVTFDTLAGGYVWNLTDKTTGSVILANQTNQSGDEDYQIVEGFKLIVAGPPLAIKEWDYEGTRWITGYAAGLAEFFGGMDLGINFFGSTLQPAEYVPILLEWQGQADVDANGYVHKGAYYTRPGYAFAGIMQAPFAAYDITDPDNPRRVNVSFVEAADNSNGIWDMGWDGTAFIADGNREYIFIHLSDYDEGASYNDDNFAPEADVLYAIWAAPRGSHPYLEGDFTMTIVPNYINTSADVFEFTALAPTTTEAIAKVQIEKVNVVPNPYLGWNPAERTPTNRVMRFTNLPADNVTIRIFDLAGNLVKVIDDNLRSEQGTLNSAYAEWDLRNMADVPVASGIYLAYVDIEGIGSKVLKIAVINREERLLYY